MAEKDFEIQNEIERLEKHAELIKKLLQKNVNDHTDTKNNLTYLSWAWAWQEFLMAQPDATYDIKFFVDKDGRPKPYLEDSDFGIMVFTSVTAGGITRDMWLPVMDGANKSMKREAYNYSTKFGDKSVDAVSMFDINKTIMRCLTKNLAMFGLGLYIYAGEDLPIEIGEPCTKEQIEKMRELKINEPNVCKKFKVEKIEELTYQVAEFVINSKLKSLEKGE
jgi:hypothetical protein